MFRFVEWLNVINVHKGILRKVQNLSVQVHLEQTMRIFKQICIQICFKWSYVYVL